MLQTWRWEIGTLYELSEVIALLDLMHCFGLVSQQYNWVKPSIGENTRIHEMSHPVSKLVGIKTVPNGIVIEDSVKGLLITGPNMSGKSTYLTTMGVVQIISQLGCFAPGYQTTTHLY